MAIKKLAVKAGKFIITLIAEQIVKYLSSEEFRTQVKEIISTMVDKVVDIVIREKSQHIQKEYQK